MANTYFLKTKTTVSKRNLNEILEKSIILNGPIGSGKTLISCELERITGMKCIHLDTMRFLQSAELYSWEIDNETDERELKKEKFLLSVRRSFPKIRNYMDFGYNSKIANQYKRRFGKVGECVYMKQFDTMLLEEVYKKIKEPCIIDMGGTMGIALEDKCKNLLKILAKEDPDLVYENINFDFMGFDRILDFLSKFKNVIELRLPDGFGSLKTKSAKCELNRLLIASGEYSRTATATVDVSGLVTYDGDKDDFDIHKLDEIVSEILTK